MGGVLVSKTMAQQAGEASLSLASLPHGSYAVVVRDGISTTVHKVLY
jgi:hypothetical protein